MASQVDYDREKEVKQFQESKMGVKGLVDSGITSVPRFFVHPPESRYGPSAIHKDPNVIIPVVDLSSADFGRRSIIVDQIRQALRTLGLFQIINHGIPCKFLDRMISTIKAFHEQQTEIKSRHYVREMQTSGVSFFSNVEETPGVWRDTLLVNFSPEPLDPANIPEICRKEVGQWDQHTKNLVELLLDMMWEGLGLNLETGRLKAMTCLEARSMVGLHYPYCPEPNLTVGVEPHTDPVVLSILLQDQIGLQVKHEEDWVDVKPIAGALIINAGDLLQIMSNDEYKSAEHRVSANPFREPRTSIGAFFNFSKKDNLCGPLPELLSPEKPALYRSFTFSEFNGRYSAKDSRDYFKI